MDIKIRITSQDLQSEVIVFTPRGNPELLLNKTQYQHQVIEKCLAKIIDCNNVKLAHHPSGEPFLQDHEDYRISISHSDDLFAIQLSRSKNVGIDVQVMKKNLFEGRSYFVNENEEKNLKLSNENLYLIWSAKEAVYKLKKGQIQKYKEGMTVVEIAGSSLLVQLEEELIGCSFVINKDFVVLYVD